MTIRNHTRQLDLASYAVVAASFARRLRGWMGKRRAELGEGLVIYPCNSIHSCFMRFPFDAVFVSRQGRVVHLMQAMPPWRVSPVVREACLVIELPAGTVASTGTGIGDEIIFEGWQIPAQ
ncbi:MAG: DUF192 domain-containing protein [Syntrophomonadaceae bacterium]|jgi:uncharacterized membrane protein (UPF0127 family)|nr:DUF192 domain-containing protein [Syntrophomonadaceae bacterium]MDH7498400.1 DUF192 domain-containing protein [Syntrophomonadaceae bacterium]